MNGHCITLDTKLAIYGALVLTLLYGCETWAMKTIHRKVLDQFNFAPSTKSWASSGQFESHTLTYSVVLKYPASKPLS